VFRGGAPGSVKSSLCDWERHGGRDIGHRVADGRDLSGSERALLLIALLGSTSHNGLSGGLGGLGAVGIKMTRAKQGGVRVFAITKRAGFP